MNADTLTRAHMASGAGLAQRPPQPDGGGELMDAAPLLPNRPMMWEFLELAFGDARPYGDGLVELAWSEASGKKIMHAQLFGLEELDDLVDHAAKLNATPGVNVYVGAALRDPEAPKHARASGEHVYVAVSAYVDIDGKQEGLRALDLLKELDLQPTFLVSTGVTPHPRWHIYWRLRGPAQASPRLHQMAYAKADPSKAHVYGCPS